MEDWNLVNAYKGTRRGEEGIIYERDGIVCSLEDSKGGELAGGQGA